jgi:hypothetical protein
MLLLLLVPLLLLLQLHQLLLAVANTGWLNNPYGQSQQTSCSCS